MLTYVDTHAHLGMLKHSPLPEILERAKAAGVEKMISVATDEASWDVNRAIAEAHPHITYSLGLHPHDAAHWKKCLPELEKRLAKGVPSKCVAIGELGLDFHYDFAPREIQLEAIEGQFLLARKHDLPVIIHCREAFDALYDCIRRVGLSPRRGVMHCFTGGVKEAKEALDLGLKISFSGILTFKNADPLREAAKLIPASELMIETDCPFLAPVPYRGKPNEPSYLPMTATVLAEVRKEPPEKIAEATTRNAVQCFRLP